MIDRLKGSWTIGEVARITKVDQRTVTYWVQSQFIVPSVEQATGRGSRRRFSYADLISLRVAGELRATGVSLQSLRKVIDRLRGMGYGGRLDTYIVHNNGDVFLRRESEVLSLLKQPGQSAASWILDLDRVVDEVNAAIEEEAA